MKQVHSFLLGGLSTALIIACSGSSDSGAKSSQPTKLDSGQVNQIVTAIKGAKWEYDAVNGAKVEELGKEGWEVIFYESSKGLYFMKKRID